MPISQSLITMSVVAIHTPDESGNTPCGMYQVTCNPPEITVTQHNTIINFQLVSPTPDSVTFTGFSVEAPSSVQQLSTPALWLDGKLMVVLDLNTVNETLDVTFNFNDSNTPFNFDPQVHNSLN